MARLSIIMPVLDEGEGIAAALDALSPLRALGVEVIVVDGGSHDATIQRSRLRADHVLKSPRGRATQMNAGAEIAAGDVLLFLHAEPRLPDAADHLVLDGLARANRVWGRFEIGARNGSPLRQLTAAFQNLRSRVTSIASGDQAIFVQREVFRGWLVDFRRSTPWRTSRFASASSASGGHCYCANVSSGQPDQRKAADDQERGGDAACAQRLLQQHHRDDGATGSTG